MIKAFFLGLVITILINLISCSGSVSDLDSEDDLIYQIPGCQNNPVNEYTLSDSGFSYSFGQNLLVDFYVSANCCPDSSRFEMSSKISNDTLFVSVTDTAAKLCDCICDYQIHFEKYNLPLNSYLIYCKNNNQVLYSVRVFRRQFY